MSCRCKCHFQEGAGVDITGSGSLADPFVITADLTETAPYYESGAGSAVTDGDFASAPANGTIAVTHNTTNGKSYLWARANGTWRAVEIT